MSGVSHYTVMEQVKRNLAVELLERADEGPRRKEDLLKFLTFESVPITPEISNRLGDLSFTAMMIGRMRSPQIKDENPRPRLSSWAPRGLLTYGKQWAMYLFMIVFLKALRRSLWMHDELQTMQVALLDRNRNLVEVAKERGDQL